MRTKRRLLLPLLISILLIGSLAWGLWLWYDANIDRSGWMETEDGTRFYQDFYADPVSGWLTIGRETYYFDEGGIPRTSWQDIGAERYYFDPDGAMATGWRELQGNHHYFTDSGAMVRGWLTTDKGRFYLLDGVRSSGWLTIDGERYYFAEDGTICLGFTQVGEDTYYLGENGAMVTGTQVIAERIFCFGDDGIMRTGWDDTEEGRRYYYEDGPMARGWTQIQGDTYYFQEDGLMFTGWMEEGEYRRYFQEDGAMAAGPLEISGETYYFSPKGIHIVLVNELNPVPGYYQLDPVKVVDHFKVDRRCYDALTQMLKDCTAAGNKYVFNSAYRTVKEQTEILELRTAEHMREYDLDYETARRKALETVAVPGTSEHHLGLAVDLLGENAIAWLQEHCWDYGFILRYTEEKFPITGIIEEPWHFRYVGVEVAQDIRESGLCLEEYLGAEPVKPGAQRVEVPEPETTEETVPQTTE